MKKILSIFLLSFISIALFAQTTPTTFDAKALLQAPTGKQQLVNDYTNTLTPDQKQTLENKLDAFDDSTSTQVAVVIVPNIGGDEIASYNVKLVRAWGVGGKQFNNGVVLLISKDDHKLNIATGYGAEGALPDVTCSDIIDNVIVPNFKGNDYYRGIDEGTDAIIKALQGEYTAPAGYHKQSGISILKIIFIIIVILVVLFGKSGGGGGFLGPLLLGSMLGGGFGGRGDGGGSGGGFGGFGGGGFGGGGASGSW